MLNVKKVQADLLAIQIEKDRKELALVRLLEFDRGYWSFGRWISGAGNHTGLGFKFTTNSANAIAARDIPKGHTAQIESADISLTREGLLAALQRFASHPHNGLSPRTW